MHDLINIAQKCMEKDSNKRLWVFFDEFNTTPNIGLLKEIICERTLLGQPLPNNMVFLGACNPQRQKKKREELGDNIAIKKYHLDFQHLNHGIDSSLLYSAVPIPETMLEYIWDYGYLNQTTENSYITAMLNQCKELQTDQNWFKCIVNSISESQKYFRENEDVSSVSLRDVARFCRSYNWFYNFPVPSEREGVMHINQIQRASLLALFLCYYFRLDSLIKRQDYIEIIENSIKVSSDILNKLLENEKMALINRMELLLGTAKNRALTDNIFVLFTCIINRLPVILCGQPGSSKTLSVQIIISNLKGKESSDPYFQTLPKLIAISYQGSYNCTSESIIKVFAQADKCTQANHNTYILPVIVFDEIGLAEISPHNPLKVLHNKLEIETCQYGFVGLSNWRLDASKMNRAIYLSTPDPNLDDLKITAITLVQSMLSNNTQTVPLDDSIIDGLAFVYRQMCKNMKQQRNQHYFGLRDYYSLIKGIVYDMIHKQSQEKDLYKIIRYHLSINFDAIIDGSKSMWSTFCEHMHHTDKITVYLSPTFNQVIDQNLSSRTGRFLLLIGENESAFDYIQRYITIKHPTIQTRTLIGSSLLGDYLSNTTYCEQYNTRILMDIILYAEKDMTLFLRGLGHLYDNLYDLFNQNFAVSAKKKYCRIALGSLYHPRCMINDNFYCIVFVKKQDLDKYDPPFLNRFQKHFIDVETLIDELHKTVISTLTQWLNQCLSMKTNQNISHSKYLSAWFNDDYILNLVTDTFDQMPLCDNDEDIIKYCQEQIIRNSSFDFPLLLSLEPTNDRDHIIQQYYEIHTDLSFSSFINQILQQEKIPKLLIYTYTQIYHIVDYSDINDHQRSVEEIKLSHFKTELELIQKIKMHHQNGFSRLLCIRVDYHEDHQHLPMLKHLLLNEHVVDESHGICLIFHLQRNKFHQIENDVFFNGWSSVMIDDLEKHHLIPQNILSNPSYADLVSHLNFLRSETTFVELIEQCIIKFRYTVVDKNLETKINTHRDQFIQQLTSRSHKDDSLLCSHIKKHLLEMISTSHQAQCKDWRHDLLTNEIVMGACRSFNDALAKTISIFLERYLSLLLAYLEKYSMIDSYHFFIHSDEKIRNKLQSLWSDCWTMITKTIDMSMMNQTYIEIPLVFHLRLPCATVEYEIIRQIRQTIAQNHQDDDYAIDFAYKQLISTSVYGPLINIIFDDPDLFDHYYHDQLTLTRNEANIHHLSTSFIQRLLTSKISNTVKDCLSHLLIDCEDLLEIMRIFEISIPLIGNDEGTMEIFDQQFIGHEDIQDKNVGKNNNFYRLVIRESNFHLVHPGSSMIEEHIFECSGNPFIEISLMNLLELLISPTHIDRINNMEQMITVYGLVVQSMIALSRGHYEIDNLEKVRSFLCLASSLSTLFPIDKALIVLKQIYNDNRDGVSFQTLDQIHNFIIYLNNIINQQQSIVDDATIHQTLLKFENELLRNWSMSNRDQCDLILKFINDHHLWKYCAKTFTIINDYLDLSSTISENSGQIPENDEYKNINQYLFGLQESTSKIEILLSMRIYMQLILDENYSPKINEDNQQHLTEILRMEYDYFQENLNEIEHLSNEQRLERLSFIAWLKYYVLYYVYALKYDIKDEIMNKIDNILVENTSSFCSTIKLYIIKQLCHAEKVTFGVLCSQYTNRNIPWIHSMIIKPDAQQTSDARDTIILPTPPFECREEFKRIYKKMSSTMTSNQWIELIRECSIRQDSAYCYIIRFIYYYTHLYMKNGSLDEGLIELIENKINEELNTCFGSVGYNLIGSLCTNFDKKSSYFHLNSSMSEKDLHQRLVILNIIALLISFKSTKNVSFLSSLLFDENMKMPKNYTEHFEKFNSLIGMNVANDPALVQMINIRTLKDSKIDIARCSSECSWLFYFINSEILHEQKRCPLCKKSMKIIRKDDGCLSINYPHIKMNINDTLRFIDEYIEQHKYGNCVENDEKPDHLNQPLTYHFISFFTHAIFLFLHELNYFLDSTPAICVCFREKIEADYNLICKHLGQTDQWYIWLYKLINHMTNKDFVIEGYLDSPEKIVQLEKFIEDKLIIPHIDSVIGEIKEYKLFYADLMYEYDKDKAIVNFVDELVEDNNKYPLLHFFNVNNIHSINFINDFHNRLQLQSKAYPLTTFLLKHLSDYDNIQYLYPIIRFTNSLIQQFNHRIKRNDAIKKPICQYFKIDSDLEINYKQFLNKWCQITLDEVYFDHQKFQWRSNFDNDTNISMFLLNKSKDSESIVLIACLQTLAKLQNDIVDYFHSNVDNYQTIPIQSIQQKHLFDFSTNKFRKFLIEKGMMINYEYGMSQEMIYDYDEIEWTLRNEINRLPRIDIKNMRYFNYQFELYDENVSLINDIRQRFEQKLFNDRKRLEMKRFINDLDNDTILQLSGSLEYILAYLRTITNQNIFKNNNTNVPEMLTIQAFIKEYIHSRICISNEFRQEPLTSINLEYIIDLHEIIEESVFDKILRKNIRGEFLDKASNNNEIQSIINEFIKMIMENNKIADCLKDLNVWISMFKRLLARIRPLKINLDFNLPLNDYVKRTDMWKGNMTKENIQTIGIKNHIRLKHAFSILEGLETEKLGMDSSEKRGQDLPNNERQRTSSTIRAPILTKTKKPFKKGDIR